MRTLKEEKNRMLDVCGSNVTTGNTSKTLIVSVALEIPSNVAAIYIPRYGQSCVDPGQSQVHILASDVIGCNAFQLWPNF